jgi:DNA-directed RNA polymerase specialized sigma24 family protein
LRGAIFDVKMKAEMNRLALKYAKSGGEDQDAFTDLYELIKPLVKAKARRSSYRTGYPKESYEDHFWEAIWVAAKSYDGSSPFEFWIQKLIKNAEVRVARVYNRKKENIYRFSMDEPEDDGTQEKDRTLYRIGAYEDPIEGIAGELDLKKMLADFQSSNEQHAKIIKLLSLGYTGQALAKHIGASRYDAKTRLTVHLARKKFQAFYNSNAS